MKANELQIGDYVNYRGQIIKVTSLYDKGGSNEVGWSEKESVWVNGRCIEPIPLTAEILKKNGFEYFHKNYSSLSYDHPFKLKMTNWPDENGLGGLWTICDIVEIRFVHQLQHALRLCEIEKEIVL